MNAKKQIPVNGHRTAYPVTSSPPRASDTRIGFSGSWASSPLVDALIIGAILTLAASYRLVRIASQPPGLFHDEAVNGVNVYEILSGQFPFYFGEREPLFMYLLAFVSLVLGTNTLALRVTAGLVGVFNVAAVGALGRQLFGKTIGFLSAFGVATSLWLTVLGRISFRATMIPGVECLGLALLWRATRTRKASDYAISGAVLAVSLYTYLAARFIPFALISFVVVCALFRRRWLYSQLRGLVIAAGAAFLVSLPLGYYGLLHPEIIFGRPDQVALPGGAAFVPALIDSIVRTLGLVLVRGDPTWRHNFSELPVFDPVSGLIFVIGLVVLLRRRGIADILCLVFGLVMLGPGMLSIDSPHYLRTIGAAGFLYLIWAVGLTTAADIAARLLRLVRASRTIPTQSQEAILVGPRFGRPRRPIDAAQLAAIAIFALGIAIATVRTGYLYFYAYPRQQPAVDGDFGVDLAATGRFLASEPTWLSHRSNVYVTDAFAIDQASVAYFLYPLLPPAEKGAWLDPHAVGTFFSENSFVPLPVAPSVYVLDGGNAPVLTALGSMVTRTEWLRSGSNHPVLVAWAQPQPGETNDRPLAQVGPYLTLIGTSVSGPTVFDVNDTSATLTLHWRVVAVPTYQPSLFVHIDDAGGHTIAQADLETQLAIDQWRPGQEIVSTHLVRLPPGTAPGSYSFSVGAYDKATGVREVAVIDGRPVVAVRPTSLVVTEPVSGVVIPDRPVAALLEPGLALVGTGAIPAKVEAGTSLSTSVVFEATAAHPDDVDAIVAVVDQKGSIVGQVRQTVGTSAFPTSRWANGTVIRQNLDVPISATASGTVELRVQIVPTVVGATAVRASPGVRLGQFEVLATSHQFTAPNPLFLLSATFSDAGQLVGYDLGGSPHSGGEVVLTLYWKGSGQSARPYTVFSHLLDASGKVVAQRDEPPDHGNRPSTGWVAGEFIADEHDITVDAGLPPGRYQIEVGLYDPSTGARVPVQDSGDSVVIGSVDVAR